MNRKELEGYLFGMLTALCLAISPIFIHKGLETLPSPIWGTAIGLLVAALLYLFWYILKKKWKEVSLPVGNSIYWQIAGGVAGAMGILFRNIALQTDQVAIVITLAQTASLFTLILAPFLLGNQLREKITPKLVAGILFILMGATFIVLGRNF